MISIRRQLTRRLLAVMLVLAGGAVVGLFLAARDAATDQFDHALRTEALAISTLASPAADGIHVEYSDRFFRGFEETHPRDFFELWDAAGRPIARSRSLSRSKDLPRAAPRGERPVFWNLTLPTGRAGRAIGLRFKTTARDASRNSPEPELELVVASDRDDLDETLWSLVSIAGGCGVLLALVTLWIVPRMLRRGLEPLDALSEQAGRIDATSLDARFSVAGLPTELQPIAARLNDLVARLEGAFERERRFNADLAHELRTPLAELQSLAECALKWPQSRDATTDRETLAIAEHMGRLVTHILALARAENGELKPALERVELHTLVEQAWRPFAGPAEVRHLTVAFETGNATVHADAALLRAILTNLFDNAVEYAPAFGTVQVRLMKSAAGTAIAVSNDAPDLDPQDLARLYDRFWRKESARSGGKHVGLGLALARSFAAAMGWQLTATLEAGWITFVLGRIE
ncbi:MAG TPA: ATP-binding protein [Opitutaceae bacterium]|nr:ATP-binding protein [Opitutaceae bacterium]